MSQSKVNSSRGYGIWWILFTALLIIAIVTGGILFGLRQWDRGGSVEIVLSNTQASALEVYLSGAVANEGIYAFSEDSSLGDIIRGAGGVSEDTDLASIEIHIAAIGDSSLVQPQKININRAEAWLLEALDGIGDTLAQRIVEYRESNGPFQSIDDLTDVSGIGSKTLENIRDEITVVD